MTDGKILSVFDLQLFDDRFKSPAFRAKRINEHIYFEWLLIQSRAELGGIIAQ
jgi:hypothetical protein